MSVASISNRSQSLTIAFALTTMLCAGVAVGVLATHAFSPAPSPNFPVMFKTDTASSGKSISMATGQIETGVEGLFVLDHLTGNLFCWILNPRTGEIGAQFDTNVRMALGAGDGEADYALATGLMDFSIARTGNQRAAQSVVYVGEGNSGRVAAYALMYSPRAISSGEPQAGELKLVTTGATRAAGVKRDQ